MYIVGQYPRFLRYHINRLQVCILLGISCGENLLTQWSFISCRHLFLINCHCIFFLGHIGSFWRLWWTSSLSSCMVGCLLFFIFAHQSPHCVFKSLLILLKPLWSRNPEFLRTSVYVGQFLSTSLCHNWLFSFREGHLGPSLLST